MAKSTRVITKNPPKKRPPVTGTLIGVRLQPPELARLDDWIAEQGDRPSRPEALRRLASKALAQEHVTAAANAAASRRRRS